MNSHVKNEYFPTTIDSSLLVPRLLEELQSLKIEIKNSWPEFKRHPIRTIKDFSKSIIKSVRQLFAPSVLVSLLTVVTVVLMVVLIERVSPRNGLTPHVEDHLTSELTILNLSPLESKSDDGIGKNGKSRVGFQTSTGEGSGAARSRAQGGGSGGENEPIPPQAGKLPPPSTILAAIPKTPPIHPPSLPLAGIDIDPALWRDLKEPVFGDPFSNSRDSSKGPGEGGGIGNNKGTGIGSGDGPGVGPGKNGNMGDGERQFGCCGQPGARGENTALEPRVFRGHEVEQRARLISKPEPQYTEEARRNQITGTVMLRVVFSSLGQVEQIRAVHPLPFGLTERAIAAARQIKFVPAMKGGRPVSVHMQLEYNFNLY